ncbi:hypothetical protein SPARM206S_01575 [Streptomyces parvulus]
MTPTGASAAVTSRFQDYMDDRAVMWESSVSVRACG